MKQKISELVDSEITDQEREVLFDDLVSGDHNDSWHRYHLIGSVIRGDVSRADSDLSASIMTKLEHEPTVLAPVMIKPKSQQAKADVWKSVGMFAIAASLVLVAVVTLQPETENLTGNAIVSNSSTVESQEQAQFSQEFDEMLVEHGEFSASPGLNGLIAYAKLVSDQQLKQ